MSRTISSGRKSAYYLGNLLIIVGFVVFASVVFLLTGSGESQIAPGVGDFIKRAFGGMACIFLGGILRGIGAAGLAGSGVVLDPEQAREDLEPYSRMVGGMAKDVLEEADIDLGGKSSPAEGKVIMIRCRQCRTLNEEGSKYCQECGQPI